ncbi:MAG: hypothetical protein IPG80_09870 [Anaerolineales bacterium]|jgi:heme-degrading monooxygenase HmoA|uniref:putative quinol monooxygenase n=1 Tax=Candidatus Villigracilis vicinus TaxID=3140679 RepID=UPI00313554C6|nr:hypothetical protein [Anaerolineales bacterium]MBK7450778.1 hypothetical protein [Anaerolineales bacterium]MBK9780661.1 hypothetical protein [Anaerolineales bacterium]
MVYINVRHTCTDYATWRTIFDGDETRRHAAGATGVKHVFRDVDDPNTVTVIIEWDNEDNARKFMNDPALKEKMQESGVIGMPAVRTLLSQA